MGTDGMEARDQYRDILLDNIDYDILIQNPQIDQEQLDEIVEILVDTVCTSRKTIRIASDDFPAEVVRSRFLKLTGSHIQYVLLNKGLNVLLGENGCGKTTIINALRLLFRDPEANYMCSPDDFYCSLDKTQKSYTIEIDAVLPELTEDEKIMLSL